MNVLIQKSSSIVRLLAIMTILGAVSGGYYLLRSNAESTNDQAVNNESISNQSEAPLQAKMESNEKPGTEQQAPATGIVIKSGDSEFGAMLFDNSGQAIYIWELEESSTAECYDDCAEAWPPVLTEGTPTASGAVNGELLGTTLRADGTTQVTYNDHPLYYYAHEKSGEVKCHNISTHGGLWWVIQPNGIRAA